MELKKHASGNSSSAHYFRSFVVVASPEISSTHDDTVTELAEQLHQMQQVLKHLTIGANDASLTAMTDTSGTA